MEKLFKRGTKTFLFPLTTKVFEVHKQNGQKNWYEIDWKFIKSDRAGLSATKKIISTWHSP